MNSELPETPRAAPRRLARQCRLRPRRQRYLLDHMFDTARSYRHSPIVSTRPDRLDITPREWRRVLADVSSFNPR
jgi:hypothetical protein